MSWLARRPQADNPVNYVTFGKVSSLLVVGLGNPGKEYDGTRHNIGFACIDEFARKSNFEPWINKKDLKCEFAQGLVGDTRVYLIKPQTFMNNSGEAVQAVQHFYKLSNKQTHVVHDELDVSFGQIRTRTGGESAGHNGIKSISQLIGDDYGRVRIGIGPKKPAQIDSADFVLQKFSEKEIKQMPNLLQETRAIISEFAYAGGQLNADTRSFIV